MTSFTPGLQRKIACALAMLMAAPFAGAASATPASASLPAGMRAATQQTPPQQTTTTQQTTPPPPAVSPAPIPQPAIVTNPPAAQTTGPEGSATTVQSQQSQTVPSPVGTAAAPVVPANGIPASRPAGAAIAPAKQRRKHSFAIRVGLIVGAAVAIGAVTAASLSSPSRPH